MSDCLVCPVYWGKDTDREPRPARRGWLTCQPCFHRIERHLVDIPGEYRILDATPGAGPGGARVSGSQEQPLGVRVNVLDLIVVAGIDTVHDASAEPDQVGLIPVVTTLDGWVQNWIEARDEGEHRPAPTPGNLCTWLEKRLDWAVEAFPAIDDFAAELKRVMGALYAANGNVRAEPEYMDGILCKCDIRGGLFRAAADSYIECSHCGNLLTESEYIQWVRLLEGALTPEERAKAQPAPRPAIAPQQRTPMEDNMITGYLGPALLTLDAEEINAQVNLQTVTDEDGRKQWGGQAIVDKADLRSRWFASWRLVLPGRPSASIWVSTADMGSGPTVTLDLDGAGEAPYAAEAEATT